MQKSLPCTPTGFMALLCLLGDCHLLTPYHLRIKFKNPRKSQTPDLPASAFQKSLFRLETWWDLHKNEKFLWMCLLLFSLKFYFPSCCHPSLYFLASRTVKPIWFQNVFKFIIAKNKIVFHRVVFLRYVPVFTYNPRIQGAWEYLKRKSQYVLSFIDLLKHVPWEAHIWKAVWTSHRISLVLHLCLGTAIYPAFVTQSIHFDNDR